MKIGTINNKDIIRVVEIHKSAFKDFFLTQLGDRFLKVYYSALNNHPKGILLGIYDEKCTLVGFSATCVESKRFNKDLIKSDISKFLLVGFLILLNNPNALIRLYKNLNKTNKNEADDGNYGELLSIAIDASTQGSGLGKQLLLHTENESIKQGIQKLSLTTDSYNNDNAIGFYHSMGYEKMYEFIAYPHRKMYRLIKTLI